MEPSVVSLGESVTQAFASNGGLDQQRSLHPLAEAGRRLVRLEECFAAGSRVVYHRTVSAVHDIMAAALEAEHAGCSRQQIVECLEPARRIHARSVFIRRLQTWPRGYPGDWESVEYLLDSQNRTSPDTVAFYLEDYALNCPAAQQHRNKVRHQADLIAETISSTPRAHILLVACGGCRDLILATRRREHSDAEFFLNDIDPEALTFARERLSSYDGTCRCVPGNIFERLKDLESEPRFDLVLAGGLFDYLSDTAVRHLLARGYRRLLKPGGTIFFTNIARGNPYRPWMEYCGNWFLTERAEGEVVRLCTAAGIPERNLEIRREETRLALLIRAMKRD